MKKLIALMIPLFLFGVDSQSFVGFEGNYILTDVYRVSGNPSAFKGKNALDGFNVGLNLGDEYSWGNYFGLRSYFTLGYSSAYAKAFSTQMNLLDVSLALEPMANLYYSQNVAFGVFGGIDLTYHYWMNKDEFISDGFLTSKHFADLAFRAGVSVLMMTRYRIEFLARLPFAYIANSKTRDIPMNISIGVSYKFLY